MYTKLKSSKKELRKETTLPPSVAEAYVGLRAYLGDGIYLLENGDLATTYTVKGIYDEPLTEDELYHVFLPYTKFLSAIGKGIPQHKANSSTVIQIICSQRVIEAAPSLSVGNSAAGNLIQHEMNTIFKGGLIKRTFYLTVRWSPEKKPVNIKRALRIFKRSIATSGENSDEFAGELKKQKDYFSSEIKRALLESSLKAISLKEEELISYYNSVFNRGKQTPYNLKFEELEPAWTSIISPACNGAPHELTYNDGNISVFTFSELPPVFALGRFRQFLDSLPLKTFDACWTVSNGQKTPGAEHVFKKMFFSQGPANQKKYCDLISFEENCSSTNPSTKMSFKLLVYDLTDDLEARVFSTAVDYLGCPIIREKQIAAHLISSALPMNCSIDEHNIIGRFKTVLLDRAICFAPIYSTSTDLVGQRHWIARNGEPIKIDIFGSGGNNHLCVLGNSESGKSCLISQFLIEFLWRFESGVIRIVDRKTSYNKICDLFEGKIVSFSESELKRNPYSPFAFEDWDEDDISNTAVFMQNAIAQLNPEAVITGLHTEILTEAIKLAANDHERNKQYASDSGEDITTHVTWIDIKKKLPTAADSKGSDNSLISNALDDIRRWTVSFDKTGQFGFLFCNHERKDNKSAGARIVVYDLDGISDPRLQVIASQLAFLKISRDLKKLPRNDRKLIVFEELGILINSESATSSALATAFVRNIVKTARKIGAQAIGITNELDDFIRSDAGKTFWKISTQKLFLPQSEAAKQDIATELGKELSLADIDIIRDLVIKKGFYSQAYLLSQKSNFKGSFLIPLSALMFAVVSTDPSIESMYRLFLEQSMSPAQAIEKMAQDHPFGSKPKQLGV